MPDGSTPSRKRGGSPRARSFEPLYRAHHAFVWRCVRRLGVTTETDDVVQEVFVTAYRRLHSFEARGSMRAWLAGIARKVAFRTRRTAERRSRRHDAIVPPPDGLDPSEWLERKEAEVFLARFLEGLDPDRRSVFVLCELEGFRGREAATALGVNPNTAYARLRSARTSFSRACERVHAQGVVMTEGRVHAAHDEQPPAGAVQRGWAALVLDLGLSNAPVLATTSWVASAKTALVTIAIGGTGLGVAQVSFGPATSGPATLQATAASEGGRPDLPAASHQDLVLPQAPSPTPVHRDATPTSRASVRPTRERRRSQPSSSRARAAPVAPAVSRGLSASELDLFDSAHKAYRERRIGKAVQLAEALLLRPGARELSADIRVLLVKAYCDQGDRVRALNAGRALDARELATLLKKHCDRTR